VRGYDPDLHLFKFVTWTWCRLV